MSSSSSKSSSLLVVPLTAAISAAIVLVLDAVLGSSIHAAALVYAKPLPPQIKGPAVDVASRVVGPLLTFAAFVAVQQTAELFIGVPFLMSSITQLESIKAPGSDNQKKVDAAKQRVIIARQTIVRTSIFVSVAAMITLYKIKSGVRHAVSAVRQQL